MIKSVEDFDKIVKRSEEAVKSDSLVLYAQKHKIDRNKTLKKSSCGKLSYEVGVEKEDKPV